MENILENINKASIKFLTPLPASELYRVIVEEARKLVKADYGSILLEEEDRLIRVYGSAPFFSELPIRKNGYTAHAFQKNQIVVIPVDDTPDNRPIMKKMGIKSVIIIPLAYKNQVIGVLNLHSLNKEHFSSKEKDILRLYCSLATLAIRKTQLYDETKKALETRDLFISLASHELRTPLTSINGYIQLLYSRIGKGDTQEAKWMRELYDESGRLTNLVKELLEINRIKQGQLQFNLRECSLRDVINQAIGRTKFTYPERNIIFENLIKDHEDLIIGDPDKLLQMLSAFLSNALKFSPADTLVTVTLTAQKKLLTISIKDQGEGIEKDDLPHIFEEFYKAPHNHREGMGVGLILAKHIIKYHKGEVKVLSEPHQGTVIEVQLPRIKP